MHLGWLVVRRRLICVFKQSSILWRCTTTIRLPSSNGQDTGFSHQQREFDSLWEYQQGERMYRIKNFEMGDHLYKYDDSTWQYKGQIASVTPNVYGVRSENISGIVMVSKHLFETQGYIAHELDTKNHQ